MFNNNFEGFIKELNDIKIMFRLLSEVIKLEYELLNLSMFLIMDLFIFLEVGIVLVMYFGGVVIWVIIVWLSVEKICKMCVEIV